MKKRIVSLLLIAVMAIVSVPSVFAVTVTDTIWDINFDNGDLSGSVAEKPVFSQTHASGCTAEFVTEPIRNNKALKLTVPASKAIRYGSESFTYDYTNKVQWYEMSIKFENNIVPFTYSVGNSATSLSYIIVEADGSLKMKHSLATQGGIDTGIDLTTGEWYHFVVAADFIYKYNSTAPCYALWLNGERMTTGSSVPWNTYTHTSNANIQNLSSGNARLFFNNSSSNDGICYVDNVKMYTSDVALSSAGYNPLSIYDGAALTSTDNGVAVVGDTSIAVKKGTTVAQLDAVLTKSASGVAYFDGANEVADTTALAVGKTVYSRSTDNVGVKTYTVEEMALNMVVEDIYDIKITAESPSGIAWTNTASSKATLAYNGQLPSSAWSHVSQADDGKGFAYKAYTTGTTGTIMNLRNGGAGAAPQTFDLSDRTTWFKVSYKFDANSGVAYSPNAPILHVDTNGDIYVGGQKDFASCNGVKVTNMTCNPGTWYDFVIALDWIDTVTIKNEKNEDVVCPKLYAWANGTLLETAQTESGCTLVWSNASALPKNELSTGQMSFLGTGTAAAAIYMNDYKVYTTVTPVIEGTEHTNAYDAYGKYIAEIVPVNAEDTIAVVKTKITGIPAEATVTYKQANGETAADSDKAIGCTMSIRSAITGGEVIYRFVEKKLGTPAITWATEDETVNGAAELSENDEVTVTYTLDNFTDDAKEGTLVIAVFDGDKLVNLVPAGATLAKGMNSYITSDSIKIPSGISDLKLKAFFWSGFTNLVPILPNEAL